MKDAAGPGGKRIGKPPPKPPSAEEVGKRYNLPGNPEEIGKAYPLLLRVPHQGRAETFAADNLGVLYAFCDKCQALGKRARKPIGPLEGLDPVRGRMVKRGCGHVCYVPSLAEVRKHCAGDLDAHLRQFQGNRTARAKDAHKPSRRLWPVVAAGAAACVLAACLLVISQKAKPKTPPGFDGYAELTAAVKEAETAVRSSAANHRAKVQAARTAYDRFLKAKPGWIMGLASLRVRIEKMERSLERPGDNP